MVKEHFALFFLLSSALYVTVFIPIGTDTGGIRAGMMVTVGKVPELSLTTGWVQKASPILSPGEASISMLFGQMITGGVTSENEQIPVLEQK